MGTTTPGRGARRPRLTGRETEVLELVAVGGTTGQIADRLGISPHTVDAHVRSVRTKLGVPTRAAAVAAVTVARRPGTAGGRGPDAVGAALLDALADGRPVALAARNAHMSLRTAHRRLRAARASLGTTTTVEAVARWAGERRAAADN